MAFAPAATGTYNDTLQFGTNANSVTVYVSGTSAMPAVLQVMPTQIDYGEIAPGASATGSFLLTNAGGFDLTITKSKPPARGAFVATTLLPEGATRPSQTNVTETVVFEPSTEGEFTDEWLIGSSAGGGTQTVTFHGIAGYGTGLSATYFDGTTLSSSTTVTRLDPTIDFDWGTRPPDAAISAPQFSVRWTGQVEALYDETYTFQTTSDDGIRVWVDGVEIIDDWTSHPKTVDTGTIALRAGQHYGIVVEYYNQSGSAIAELAWSSPSTPAEIVPAAFLFPSSGE
jgi:hypothetical protein